MSSFHSFTLGISSIFILLFFSSAVQAVVPHSKTFTIINDGDFGDHNIEYGDYRLAGINNLPFVLCFYNTTPNAYTLALRMGLGRSASAMHWVWQANLGNPVHDNATLTFGRDGNLVLADDDGRIAWQTGTANKGVVDLNLLPNGNLILQDKHGRFVWQSFDYPTDTLLVGQSLRLSGPNKLTSRASIEDGSQGPYSMIMEPNRLSLYLKSKNSQNPLLYYTNAKYLSGRQNSVKRIMFNTSPTLEGTTQYDLTFDLYDQEYSNNTGHGYLVLSRPKYNATFSMLRLGIDGNLRIYTHFTEVAWSKWEVTYTLFTRDSMNDYTESECYLPKKCGSLGVCEDDQCVACPTPKGSIGWRKTCAPPTLSPCKAGNNVKYYKVLGVEHFMNPYTEGDGPMSVVQCRDKCNKDCGCLGFFYREESSKCLLAPELGTLTQVSNMSRAISKNIPHQGNKASKASYGRWQ